MKQEGARRVAVVAVLLLVIFTSFGKMSKQLGNFVEVGMNLALTSGGTAPSTPTYFKAVSGACGGQVNLSWETSSGATSYEIYSMPGGNRPPVSTTSFVDTNLTPGATYGYQIRALNGTLASAWTLPPISVTASSACSPTESAPPPPPAPTVTLSASPATITAGNSSTIIWSSSDAAGCSASGGWSGTKTTSGSESVSPTANTTYTLSCFGSGGTTTQSTTVTVNAPPPPPAKFDIGDKVKTTSKLNVRSAPAGSRLGQQPSGATGVVVGGPTIVKGSDIWWNVDYANAPDGWAVEGYLQEVTSPAPAPTINISASSATITSGNSSTITWSSTNATSCSASGGWSGTKTTSGSESVSPTANTTYTLSCSGAGGSVNGATTITVTTPTPTVTLSASPTSITSGNSSTLTWSSTNATSCSASGGWTGGKSTSGTQSVSPTANTTYTLTCTGSGGSANQNITVSVTAAPPPTQKFIIGDSVQTTASLNVRGTAGGTILGQQPLGALGKVLAGPVAAGDAVWWNIDYVNAPDGWSFEGYLLKATTAPTPTVTLSASPTSITSGNSSTLTWSSTNATSCSASGGWTGGKSTSGTQSVSPTANTTYTLTCTGSGGSQTKSVTVNVGTVTNPQPTVTLSSSPTSVTAGQSATLTWSSINATSCTASGGWTGSKATSGTEVVTPSTNTTYTLTCTGVGGSATQSISVTVGSTTSILRMNFKGTQSLNVFAGFNLIGSIFGDNGASTSNVDVTVQNPIPNSTFKWAEGDCCIQSTGGYYFYKGNGDIAYRISTSAATPPGSYTVILTAKDRANGATATLNIPVTVLPAPQPLATQTPGTPPALSAMTKYVSDMNKYGLTYCNSSISPGVESGVWYYDGERVYYNLSDYTGDPSWASNCAQWVESMYRNYVITNNGSVPGWRRFSKGLRMDFERTGDAQSQSAALMLGKAASYPLKWNVEQESSREIAYSINAMIDAEKLGAGRNPKLQDMVDLAVGHMDQWVIGKNANYLPPFMLALTSEALIGWYDLTGDPRVPVLVKTAADFMWNTLWDATAQAFPYYDRTVTGQGSRTPSPDLNNLISPIYGWLYHKTGDISYVTKGDQLFTGGVNKAWLGNGKQFSQNYRWSMNYLKWTGRIPNINITP